MPVHARVFSTDHATSSLYGLMHWQVTPTCYSSPFFSFSRVDDSSFSCPLPSAVVSEHPFSSNSTKPTAARWRLYNLVEAAEAPYGCRRPSSCHLTAHINARHATHHLSRSRIASAITSVSLLLFPRSSLLWRDETGRLVVSFLKRSRLARWNTPRGSNLRVNIGRQDTLAATSYRPDSVNSSNECQSLTTGFLHRRCGTRRRYRLSPFGRRQNARKGEAKRKKRDGGEKQEKGCKREGKREWLVSLLSLHTRSRSSDDGPRLLAPALPSVYCCRWITGLCCSFACRGERGSWLPLFSPITSYHRHRRRRFFVSAPFSPGAISSARLYPSYSSLSPRTLRVVCAHFRTGTRLFFSPACFFFFLPRLCDTWSKAFQPSRMEALFSLLSI